MCVSRAQILTTSDAGHTWDANSTEPFALLLLDISAYGRNIGVIGALSMMYSNDAGAHFNNSVAPFGAGQCIRVIGDNAGFAAVGQWGLFDPMNNGPVVSYDGGATFTAVNDTALSSDARYGAFPTLNDWYVTAGDWPDEGDDIIVDPDDYLNAVPRGSSLVRAKGARAHLLRRPGTGVTFWGWVKRGHLAAANGKRRDTVRSAAQPYRRRAQSTDWIAQITSSHDAGKTWQLGLSVSGQFYMSECGKALYAVARRRCLSAA